MAKYHINPKTGNPGVCHAKKSCPFGDLQSDHYNSKEDARNAYENKMGTNNLAATSEDKGLTLTPTPDYMKIANQLTTQVEHGVLGQVVVDEAYAEENKFIELDAGTKVGETVWVGESVDGLTIPARTREEVEGYLTSTYYRELRKGTFD
jgi:hypothetical protein